MPGPDTNRRLREFFFGEKNPRESDPELSAVQDKNLKVDLFDFDLYGYFGDLRRRLFDLFRRKKEEPKK